MKTFFTFILILVFTAIIKAQAPDFLWQKIMYTTFPHDSGKSIFETPDGGFVIFGTKFRENYDVDYWLFKLDSERNIVWEKFYGDSGNDEAGNMIITSDGNYLMAGSSNSQNGDVNGNHGSSDIWLVKVDNSGNILWEKSYGGSNSELYGKIFEMPGNGYLLITSSSSMDENVGGNNGSADYWIVKIDENGEIDWENNFGGSDYEVPVSAISTFTNEYIIVGYSDSNDGDVSNPKGNFDFWVIKIDSNGELMWEKSFGGNNRDEPIGIMRDHQEEDEFLVFGNSNSSNGDVSNPLGANDGWVVKIDPDGNFIWDKSFGGSGNDGITDFKLSQNNGYVYSGIYQDGQLSKSTIEETDADGNEIWQMLFGSVGWAGIEPYLHEIKYSIDGNLIAVGSNTTDTSSNVWLGKIGLENLGNNESSSKKSMIIFPNPTNDYFTIKSSEPLESVKIYNLNGQLVFHCDLNKSFEFKIDVINLSKGNYLVSIKTVNETSTHSLLIK